MVSLSVFKEARSESLSNGFSEYIQRKQGLKAFPMVSLSIFKESKGLNAILIVSLSIFKESKI